MQAKLTDRWWRYHRQPRCLSFQPRPLEGDKSIRDQRHQNDKRTLGDVAVEGVDDDCDVGGHGCIVGGCGRSGDGLSGFCIWRGLLC